MQKLYNNFRFQLFTGQYLQDFWHSSDFETFHLCPVAGWHSTKNQNSRYTDLINDMWNELLTGQISIGIEPF